MNTQQCDTCGSFLDGGVCGHCGAPVCTTCKFRHESYCKVLQPLRLKNAGATVNRLENPPAPAPVLSPVDIALAAVQSLLTEEPS